MAEPLRVLIVAGEPSGDMHGAALMRALQELSQRPIAFRGCGGDAMRRAGATLLFHTDQTAVMGLVEVLKNFRFFRHMLRRMVAELRTWHPDLLLTIDYPGFNLRLAATAHAAHIRTIHYICPQVWAWHQSRIPKIARVLDHLLTILPFEPACFAQTKLPVTFVGHPLVDRAAETFAEPQLTLPWQPHTRRVALLPGSRRPEIARIFPDMLAAAAQIADAQPPGCTFIVPTPSPAIRAVAEKIAAQCRRRPPCLHFVDNVARQVLRQAEAALVASGTATLEAALMRCPTVLVYRLHPVTAFLARFLISGVKHAGLANILATRCLQDQQPVMPELLQQDFTPARAAALINQYLQDDALRAQTIQNYDAATATLGAGAVSQRAANTILQSLGLVSGDNLAYAKERFLQNDDREIAREV